MRVDTTVVETNIHHPTDSTLLGDGSVNAYAERKNRKEPLGHGLPVIKPAGGVGNFYSNCLKQSQQILVSCERPCLPLGSADGVEMIRTASRAGLHRGGMRSSIFQLDKRRQYQHVTLRT
jgi:hypothetical protein